MARFAAKNVAVSALLALLVVIMGVMLTTRGLVGI